VEGAEVDLDDALCETRSVESASTPSKGRREVEEREGEGRTVGLDLAELRLLELERPVLLGELRRAELVGDAHRRLHAGGGGWWRRWVMARVRSRARRDEVGRREGGGGEVRGRRERGARESEALLEDDRGRGGAAALLDRGRGTREGEERRHRIQRTGRATARANDVRRRVRVLARWRKAVRYGGGRRGRDRLRGRGVRAEEAT